LAPADGFVVRGDGDGDRAGASVASAGDVNGDGFDDLVLGAPRGDDGGESAGEAYVVFGAAGGFGTVDGSGRSVVDLTTLAAADGFVIHGGPGDLLGRGLASAGDMNGDGFDDLFVAAPAAGENGEAYVVFGNADGFGTVDAAGRSVLDIATLTPADGIVIRGDPDGGSIADVASAGDVNGDGLDDLIVGAALGASDYDGNAYVIFGRSDGVSDVDLRDLGLYPLDGSGPQGFVINGDDDGMGRSVASAGDVNADGFDDLVVGAPRSDEGGERSGAAYVIFGSDSLGGTVIAGAAGGDALASQATADAAAGSGDGRPPPLGLSDVIDLADGSNALPLVGNATAAGNPGNGSNDAGSAGGTMDGQSFHPYTPGTATLMLDQDIAAATA
ncbi:MAG: integrin alpha, partial [Vicinamibacterales bacterium]